jgi:hypothetical protein
MSQVRWVPVLILVRQPASVPVCFCDENGWRSELVVARALSECRMVFPIAGDSDEKEH